MNKNKKTERKKTTKNHALDFSENSGPPGPSPVFSNLGALQDAECEELLRQTEEYEALRFLKDGKIQVTKSNVSILPKPANSPCPVTKLPFQYHGVG